MAKIFVRLSLGFMISTSALAAQTKSTSSDVNYSVDSSHQVIINCTIEETPFITNEVIVFSIHQYAYYGSKEVSYTPKAVTPNGIFLDPVNRRHAIAGPTPLPKNNLFVYRKLFLKNCSFKLC